MKNYVAIQFANTKRGKTGFTLYEVVDNTLRHLGITGTFSRGMTRGGESEALNALCDAGLAPKERRDTYYHDHCYNKDCNIRIQYIMPRKQ